MVKPQQLKSIKKRCVTYKMDKSLLLHLLLSSFSTYKYLSCCKKFWFSRFSVQKINWSSCDFFVLSEWNWFFTEIWLLISIFETFDIRTFQQMSKYLLVSRHFSKCQNVFYYPDISANVCSSSSVIPFSFSCSRISSSSRRST